MKQHQNDPVDVLLFSASSVSGRSVALGAMSDADGQLLNESWPKC